MIDIHMHVGRLYGEGPLEPEYLLDFMDRSGIEKAALLPIENPEDTSFYVTTERILEVCRERPERFIPFCNVDPRRAHVAKVIEEYRERGCKGFGEILVGLSVDHPLMRAIYGICGELKLPIIFDLSGTTCLDDIGLPKFEKMIRSYPETIFIGHGPHFWAEISSDVRPDEMSSYPKRPVQEGGAAVRLLAQYPNAHADLSAGSGHNALTRDAAFGYQFLEDFQDKLFFGTDICHTGHDVPIVPYFRRILAEGKISPAAHQKITKDNAKRILKI